MDGEYLLSLEQSWQHVRWVRVGVVQVARECRHSSANCERCENTSFDAVKQGNDNNYRHEMVEHLNGEPPCDKVALIRRVVRRVFGQIWHLFTIGCIVRRKVLTI